MANTEGMPDEVVESLLGPSLSIGTRLHDHGNTDTASRRRRVLEDRMSMTMGERPAATVVRACRNGGKPAMGQGAPGEHEPNATAAQFQESKASPPIMGDIVERPARQGHFSSNNHQLPSSTAAQIEQEDPQPNKKRQSRFAQQRYFQANSASTGFPSVNIPLGTFVKPKCITAVPKSSSQSFTAATTALSSRTTAAGSSSTVTFRDACRQDADAMLAQMSREERAEKAEELKEALPPEMVAFLKKRAASRRHNVAAANNKTGSQRASFNAIQDSLVPTTQQDPLVVSNCDQEDQPPQAGGPRKDDAAKTEAHTSVDEKKRMAKILSNIKTYQDLDSAYKAEMGSYVPSTDDASNANNNSEESDDWKLACNLLRSTSPRQNLWAAKVVSEHLQQQWKEGDACSVVPGTSDQAPAWPYPVMLPASLRCLLDAPFMHTNGYVLHTYVIQALYSLLKLRACADHVVDITDVTLSSSNAAILIYQEYFLDDAVPTPTSGECYESIAKIEPLTAGGPSAVAYKTSSYSTSAQQDGEAFAKDPMWTLLSRMCILPRISQLLRTAEEQNPGGSSVVPKEAIVSICGILAMLGQRSPGAASAIANHPSILKDLLELTVVPRGEFLPQVPVDNDGENPSKTHGSHPYDPQVALPAIILLCCLARQSRVAASAIPIDDVVPPILALKAATEGEHKLQKWSVILWRILLRYGLGVPQIPIMLTLAASHMTLGFQLDSFSLSTEFASSFVNVLHCVQIARRHASSANAKATEVKNSVSVVMLEQQDMLLQADGWMAASVVQVLAQLEWSPRMSTVVEGSNVQCTTEPSSDILDLLQFYACRLQFLSLAHKVKDEKARLSREESKRDGMLLSSSTASSCQKILLSLLEHGTVQQSLVMIAPSAFVISFAEIQDNLQSIGRQGGKHQCLQAEATACSFVCSFASLQLSLLAQAMDSFNDKTPQTGTKDFSDLSASLERFERLLALYLPPCTLKTVSLWARPTSNVSIARMGWLNRACFAVVELLMATNDFICLVTNGGGIASPPLRELQFVLAGRLQRGDEAIAAMLFSQDSSFSPKRSSDKASALSSVLFRELCGSIVARHQLDHSFKLRRGPGITADEYGPFKLNSLLSEADLDPHPGKTNSPDFVLPLGTVWLWQVLSSSLHSQVVARAEGNEVEQVLTACLEVVVELEDNKKLECRGRGFEYARRIPSGAKAYHLVNICLHPERILQSVGVVSPSEALFATYSNHVDETFVMDFARACVLHSGLGKKPQVKSSSEDNAAAVKEKLTSQLLDPLGADNAAYSQNTLGPRELRSLEQFVGDLCDAYTEYGAQYDLFTSFVLLFLRPAFPSKVRCLVLNRLGDIIHRISIPGEDSLASSESRSRLASYLAKCLGSGREPPQFLDAYATVYSKGGAPQLAYGYILVLGVLVFTRHLAACILPKSLGLEAATKRLGSMDAAFVSVVLDATERFLVSNEQNSDYLVAAVLGATIARCTGETDPPENVGLMEVVEHMKMLIK